MQRITLIIIVLVLVILAVGLYFVFMGSDKNTNPTNNQNGDKSPTTQSFDIDGMKVEVLKTGTGVAAKNNDRVTVNYVGVLANGVKFDSSIDRNAPYSFTLGQGKVIKGWDLGVAGMKVGEKRKLTIPPDLAYGSGGFMTIPPSATLTFEVELLKID